MAGARQARADRGAGVRRGVIVGIIFLAISLLAIAPVTAQGRMKFGAHVQPRAGQELTGAMKSFENKLGHRLSAARIYFRWDSTFPSNYARWAKSTGHKIYMSVKALRDNNTYVSWRNIADARRGSDLYKQMVRWAERIKRFGSRVHFTFNHEPEGYKSDPNGSSKAFKDAWRKFHTVFHRKHVRNVRWLWTMTDWAFVTRDDKRARLWYPGNHFVDEIGATAYNWHRCRGESWEPLSDSLEGIRRFGRHHRHKELVVSEWGSVEDWSDPGRKARWLNQARELFKRPGWGQFDALLYFSANVTCSWFADTTSSSFTAFKRMASDPFYTRR
jgi:hypothetical protein